MKVLLLAIALFSFCTAPLLAAGGTSIVASPGQKAHVSPNWPEKVREIVNDPLRTSGWNSWFTEWPNDVNHYGFKIASMDEVNRLVEKLAKVNSPLRQIHLAPTKEPEGLGWVTSLPKGNGIAVIFSIGDHFALAADFDSNGLAFYLDFLRNALILSTVACISGSNFCGSGAGVAAAFCSRS
jgi:hypothetical protein